MPNHTFVGTRRASAAIALACLALVGLGWAITLERIAYEHEQAIAGARVHNANLALAFQEHTIRTVKGLDGLLRSIRREYRENGRRLDLQYLAEESALDPSVLATAGVVDERGDIVAALKGSETTNVADRDYFEHHRSHAADELRIGRPVIGLLTGAPVIHVTRRIERPDGGFAGVALVGIDPDYFASFYNLVDLGPGGMVALVGADGVVRAARGDGSAAAVNAVSPEMRDGVRRYMSYRTVRGYPLAVAVASAEAHVLGEWRQRKRNYLAGAGAATLLVLLFGLALFLVQRRHAAAAAEARRSEARYRTTFDEAGVGIAEATREGRFLRVNRKLCELLGYSAEELRARSWPDVTHGEDAKRAIALIAQSAADPAKPVPPMEKRYLRKDGTVLWGVATIAPVRDAQGRTDYFVTMLQDITARKHAEEAVREAQERFRQLAENIREVFWLTDPTKNEMLYVSPGYREIWGRSCESVYASPRDWIDAIHPEDRERVLHAAQTRQASGEYAEEYRIVRPDGTVRWIRDRAFPVRGEAGEVYRIAGVAEDITAQHEAAEALRESERRFRDMLGRVELVSLMLDRDARVTYCNDYLLELTGWRRNEVLGRDWFELFIPADEAPLKSLFRQLLEDLPKTSHHENQIITRAGERRTIRWNNTVLRSVAGEVIGTASIGEDITESLRSRAEVAKAEARYRATFDHAAIGIAHTSPQGRFLKVNDKLCSMLGRTQEELLSGGLLELTHPEDVERSRQHFQNVLCDPGASLLAELEKRYVRKDGSVLWAMVSASLVRDAHANPDYFVVMMRDMTGRKLAQEQLAHQAHYDALTDLPNRVLFQDRLEQAVVQARRHDWSAGILFIDIDNFKTVNDTLGHEVGDRLLQLAAKRLLDCVRASDTIARVGGDEFAVVLPEIARAQDAAIVAEKMLAGFAAPFRIDQHELYVSASIGIAAFPADGEDSAALLRNADTAMFRAKDNGRANYQFYTAEMNERAMEKLLLSNDLRRALGRGELLLHFQPKASLAEGRIKGFEALLRWNHPERGMVSPALFVPLLEDSGMIVEVGAWVIGAACRQIAAWRDAGLEPLPVAVNLSAKQFMHAGLIELIKRALAGHAVPRGLLELEITESHVMKSPAEAARILGELRALGVGIAIDDFGTGYSSLSYLKRLPVDTLKIDRSFVSGLPADGDDASISCAIITLAHSLGLRVVAEGVETQEQRDFLARNHCDEMQGYLLSRPQPAAEAARLLRRAAPKLAA